MVGILYADRRTLEQRPYTERELRLASALARSAGALLAGSVRLAQLEFTGRVQGSGQPAAEPPDPFEVKDGLDLVSRTERELVRQALEQADGNRRKAARLLGWYPQKLYDRIRRYDLD